MSFGMKGCSLKWKASIMDKFVEEVCVQTKKHLEAGGKVSRLIGYDNGKKDKCRGAVVSNPHLWDYLYPLRDWKWDREDCGKQLLAAGLPLIHKSACVFCASMQIDELVELADNHPDLLRLAIQLEDNASPFLEGNMTQEQLDGRYQEALCKHESKMVKFRKRALNWLLKMRKGKKPSFTPPKPPRRKTAGEPGLVQGLWRSGVAGKRDKSKYRPGSWRKFCEDRNLLPDDLKDVS
jgi:hypothetical protein